MPTQDLLISSNPSIGAEQVSQDGSSVLLHLDSRLNIHHEAKDITLSVIGCEIWYNFPNVTDSNNMFIFYVNGIRYERYLPEGLYSGATIPDAFLRKISESSVPNLPTGDWFVLEGDEALNRMTLKFNQDAINKGFIMAWTESNISSILGFTTDSKGSNTHIGEDLPTFNQVNYLLLQSDLAHNGVSINGEHNSILAKINIDVSPNSQILYAPSNPAHISVPELAGTHRRDFRFNILDDKMRPINTRGEYWSCHIRLRWR